MIEFINIEKSFFGVKVLKHVSLAVKPGRTMGLVGENGAGKSTLMNILGGNLHPDSGRMLINGKPYAPNSPRDAAHAGIAFIHQELNLFPNLSIADNICIDNFDRIANWLPIINGRKSRERTRKLLAEVSLNRSPETLVADLSAGEKQLVEIAKALALDAKLIIFDEPTTSLTARETEHLFSILATLRARGISMIYISHCLEDVMRLCDEITVLRDGQVVGNGIKGELTIDRMVSMMVGREINQLFPPRSVSPSKDTILDVSEVNQPGVARNISFQLHAGEILGVAGLMGSGRSELARILFGLDPVTSGAIKLNGVNLNGLSTRNRIDRGLALLTEERRSQGLCMDASIADNLLLAALPRFAGIPSGIVDRNSADAAISGIRNAVNLTSSARNEQPVKTLSGGNQQKVVIAKWLLNEPKVFILDEPTRGIDIGAKHEIYRLINHLVSKGAAVLMISSEIEELIGMCDRILVMRKGEIAEVIWKEEFNRERILRSALHSAVS